METFKPEINFWSPDNIKALDRIVHAYIKTRQYAIDVAEISDIPTANKTLLNFNDWKQKCYVVVAGMIFPSEFKGKTAKEILSYFADKPTVPLTAELKTIRDHVKKLTETPDIDTEEKIEMVLKQSAKRIKCHNSNERAIVLTPIKEGLDEIVPFSFIESNLSIFLERIDPEKKLGEPVIKYETVVLKPKKE